MVNDVPMTLIGRPTLPANNYAELAKWLEANKGKINLGQRRPGRRLAPVRPAVPERLKMDMTTVPYKGTAPAMTDLIGGQVDLMCDQTTNTSAQIEGKKVKAYAVTTAKRLTTPGAEGPADAAGVGPEGLRRHHLARPVRAQGHAGRRCSRSSTTP